MPNTYDELRDLAWAAFTSGTPRDQLKPEYRDAADELVRRGEARWAQVITIGDNRPEERLRWNFPTL